MIKAQNKISTNTPCFFGSLPNTLGTMYIPAANQVVATQKITNCTCHVFAILNGKSLCISIPKIYSLHNNVPVIRLIIFEPKIVT